MRAKLYENDMLNRLAENLEKNKVDKKIIGEVMEGGHDISKKIQPRVKAEWMKNAMIKMQKRLDLETCKMVREGCACCTGGKRDKLARAIGQKYATLEERIKAANEEHYVFGHSVTREDDGTVTVKFMPEGLPEYFCPCNSKAQMTMPITYCFCCGGHIKHHLQNALGHEMDCTTIHTVRSTGGKKPCTFNLKIIE